MRIKSRSTDHYRMGIRTFIKIDWLQSQLSHKWLNVANQLIDELLFICNINVYFTMPPFK
ncbi:CLUMA_CG013040, isoform A [Clunio marinus]|uniref:CLUMA_CG013040, isoform A n=1 Tax=Clunio marinus TaxID=568069 RepID=A0A1J1IHH1_9DIPT|nr:CLUMA_CG013040, isoform A [Clunio marinus]